MSARTLMVLGTSSHVGKSMVTTALCRIFARAGYKVAPFKAQNMSLNSAATPEGLEIGRAQALQAEAAGIAPSVHMNPILLKPTGNASSQVIVQGKIWKTLDAKNYHKHRMLSLLPIVEESYRNLASEYDIIVLEGAGSPAEINLKQNDIVNMRMAAIANAQCLLVGDIDRGGVFASLLGTVELLDEEERQRICGFVINKFRGDQQLLMPGVVMMEQRLRKPCMGIIPYLPGFALDEEDSVAVEHCSGNNWPEGNDEDRKLRIAVIAFPSLSNFTDFDALRAEPSVLLRYVRNPCDLTSADAVILPGSKQTIEDLRWLKSNGFDKALYRVAARDGWIIGICGGFQMLGQEVRDPHHMEGIADEKGLSMLPIRTVLAQEKVTALASGVLQPNELLSIDCHGCAVSGYEIHLGETAYLSGAIPFAEITRRAGGETTLADGCVSSTNRTFGTYLHGIFDEDSFRHLFLRRARSAAGLKAPEHLIAWSAHRQAQLDRLADEFGRALNLSAIFGQIGLSFPGVYPSLLMQE